MTMSNKFATTNPDAPLCHPEHPRPITRRQLLSQGFVAGTGSLMGAGAMSLFANPRAAYAALSPDLQALTASCGIAVQGAGKIPFIGFDLAGGASMAGSNVLVGKEGGQMDFLSTEGYAKLGLPGDMIPPVTNPQTGANDFINTDLGLAFHSDSAFLRGMMMHLSPATMANINGCVIPARSENDTGNNPHNPMYGIAQAGADGELLTLIGSRSSDSGGNSMAPAMLMDQSIRPTKVDRASDVTGLVDTGKLVGLLAQEDAVAVMESIQRISDMKLGRVDTNLEITADEVLKDLVNCGYVKAADLADRFGEPGILDPDADLDIVGDDLASIFTQADYEGEREFRKTAAVMKMVVNGFCLEYAARKGLPLMLYVFSDGSLSANGTVDNSEEGRGKFEWVSDNQSTAASFFLVYNPGGRPQLMDINGGPERHQQIGWFQADGSVQNASTPAANNVNLLVQTVILNYMALHGDQGLFPTLFPTNGLGNSQLRDSLTAFQPIVNGTI
jgi:hypothetical protein